MSHCLVRCLIFAAMVVATGAGCSGRPGAVNDDGRNAKADTDEIPPDIVEALRGVASEQSQGLKNASVVVHSAYAYSGYSWLEPLPEAKLIAVDVEFSGYDRGLDLDDVDILDGDSGKNFGSDPHIAHLNRDGTLAADPDDASWPIDMGPIRVLLVYAMPKESTSIKLSYWGNELTPAAIRIADSGLLLPEPAEKH